MGRGRGEIESMASIRSRRRSRGSRRSRKRSRGRGGERSTGTAPRSSSVAVENGGARCGRTCHTAPETTGQHASSYKTPVHGVLV